MLDLPVYLTDIRQLGTLLTASLTAIAGLCSLVLMIGRRGTDLPVKLVGSLFVLAICFAAQSGVVYGIGVFVVATLVTELQFLEKIAALVWNRKEYWEYLGKASNTEVAKKIEQESKQIEKANAQSIVLPASTTSGGTPTAERRALSGLHFHRQVLRALQDQSPIPYMGIRTDVKVRAGDREYLLDAILESSSGIYVVEIKAGFSPRLLRDAVSQLRRYIAAAGHIVLGHRYAAYPLGGVVIIPPSEMAPLSEGEIAILQFDPVENRFVNGEAVRQYLEASL